MNYMYLDIFFVYSSLRNRFVVRSVQFVFNVRKLSKCSINEPASNKLYQNIKLI